MADILPFRKRKQNPRASRLCREGHHRWQVDKSRVFDVKQGKLVTQYRCSRCGKTRTTAH